MVAIFCHENFLENCHESIKLYQQKKFLSEINSFQLLGLKKVNGNITNVTRWLYLLKLELIIIKFEPNFLDKGGYFHRLNYKF